jgi:hypothetical protein
MRPKTIIRNFVGSALFLGLIPAVPALATQGHAGIEGVWVHQFAHLFFLLFNDAFNLLAPSGRLGQGARMALHPICGSVFHSLECRYPAGSLSG